MTKKNSKGFTIVELIIVIAIIGILAGIGFVNLPRDRFAVRQAAQGLANDITHARFLAISRNVYTVVDVDESTNVYRILNRASSDTYKTVGLSDDDRTPLVEISSVDQPDNDIVFDPRGVGIGLGPQTIVIGSTTSDYARTVRISQQGRVVVE